MIRRMAMVFIPGQMEENTKETGKMENSMVLENIPLQMETKRLENGLMEKY